MATKTFDPRCHDLATLFLSDHPALNTEAAKVTLASAIQQVIEDEIDFIQLMMEKA